MSTPPELEPFLAELGALAPVTPDSNGPMPGLSQVMDTTVVDLGSYWSVESIRLFGVAVDERPALAPYRPSSGAIPPCGLTLTAAQATRQAFYCSSGNVVAWDAEFLMPEAYTFFHPLTPAAIIAHEWAHAIQFATGTTGDSLTLELQADCFAGSWLAQLDEPTLADLVPRFLDRAPAFFAWIGDPHGNDVADEDRHGTARQRLAAFTAGYEGGGEVCVLYETALPPEIATP